MDWKHKSEWSKRGNNFMIIVSRHHVEPPASEFDRGCNQWAVYAYLYPKHHLFDSFNVDDGIFQDAARNMPLHCGPSYFMVHRASNEGNSDISAIQIGSDYGHLYDAHYTHYTDDDLPADVFDDADRLFQYLTKE